MNGWNRNNGGGGATSRPRPQNRNQNSNKGRSGNSNNNRNSQWNNDDKGADANRKYGQNRNNNNNNNNYNKNHQRNNGADGANPNRIERKSHPIGYMKLRELMNELEDADLMLRLSSETGGFITLLQETKIRPDLLCLVLELLAKIANSSTDGHTRRIQIHFYTTVLSDSKSDKMSLKDHLVQFVGALVMNLEGDQSQYMKAVNHLLIFMRNLQEVILRASADFVRSIIVPLGGIIDYMNRKGCVFKVDFMENYALINETSDKFVTEREEEKKSSTNNGAVVEYKPPNDFREIPICPQAEDIQFDYEQFLPKSIVDGGYASGVDHYLDIQFRLLREDFVRPLRVGVTEYIELFVKNPKKLLQLKKVGDLNIYRDVRIVNSMLKNGEIIHLVQFDIEPLKSVRWQVIPLSPLKIMTFDLRIIM